MPAALEGIEGLIQGVEQQFSMEYPCHAPNRERWFLMHAVRADYTPATVVISHTDITERRNATEKRSRRTVARTSSWLLSPMSCVIPSPRFAMPLTYCVSTASKRQPSLDTRKILAISERQVEHLIRLVDDPLEAPRITTGKISLQKQETELSQIMKNACEMAKPNIEANGQQLEVRLPPAPAWICGDPVRLTQIFSNLLNNAAKYTEQGGAIFFECEKVDEEAIVSVRDTGMGIPQDMLPHVFDLFAQVDRTLGRAQDGLGISLAVVKSLVDMHGGSVEAQSGGVGNESKFTVRLPLIAGPKKRPSGEPQKPTSPTVVSSKVLVIDDDHDVADTLAMLLESLGARVHREYGGEGGVKGVQAFRPDLVFLDLGMPGIDGYETVKRIGRFRTRRA